MQVKRLHEYKRQLLNALHILVLYNRICDDPTTRWRRAPSSSARRPRRGYRRAKRSSTSSTCWPRRVASHARRASKMIQIVFLQNYNVSTAEMLMPASEVSEQLSTASRRPAAPGNMKFMMNGAVTIGTLDGANVEIADLVGPDNCYIFGMRSNEVEALYAAGTYRSLDIYETNAELRRALNMMFDGSLTPEKPEDVRGSVSRAGVQRQRRHGRPVSGAAGLRFLPAGAEPSGRGLPRPEGVDAQRRSSTWPRAAFSPLTARSANTTI